MASKSDDIKQLNTPKVEIDAKKESDLSLIVENFSIKNNSNSSSTFSTQCNSSSIPMNSNISNLDEEYSDWYEESFYESRGANTENNSNDDTAHYNKTNAQNADFSESSRFNKSKNFPLTKSSPQNFNNNEAIPDINNFIKEPEIIKNSYDMVLNQSYNYENRSGNCNVYKDVESMSSMQYIPENSNEIVHEQSYYMHMQNPRNNHNMYNVCHDRNQQNFEEIKKQNPSNNNSFNSENVQSVEQCNNSPFQMQKQNSSTSPTHKDENIDNILYNNMPQQMNMHQLSGINTHMISNMQHEGNISASNISMSNNESGDMQTMMSNNNIIPQQSSMNPICNVNGEENMNMHGKMHDELEILDVMYHEHMKRRFESVSRLRALVDLITEIGTLSEVEDDFDFMHAQYSKRHLSEKPENDFYSMHYYQPVNNVNSNNSYLAQPVKRGRGRPRKMSVPGEEFVKRSRGRPRKDFNSNNIPIAIDGVSSGSDNETMDIRRNRGRPRKNSLIDENRIKRPRGRPRKDRTDLDPLILKRPRGRPRKAINEIDLLISQAHQMSLIPPHMMQMNSNNQNRICMDSNSMFKSMQQAMLQHQSTPIETGETNEI